MSKVIRHGSCHCGEVRYEVNLDLSAGTGKCNCSICTKTRNWGCIVGAADFRMIAGHNDLSDYQFGSHSMHHLFCEHCGVRSFGRGHLDSLGGEFYSINVACLDDAPIEELVEAPVTFSDGRRNMWQSAPAEVRHL